MAIPLDTYFIVTPSSEFISKAYGILSGTDLFFYVNETNSLRVVNMTSTNSTASPGTFSYTLAQGAKWVDVVSMTGIVHVYYADANGNVFYIPYTTFGALATPVALSLTTALTFSVIHTVTSTPPSFIMMIDDGIKHNLYVATDSMFTTLLATPKVTYNNTLNTNIYITRPAIAMHPQDTNKITVTCQHIVVLSSVSTIGFYEVLVPGVV